MSMPDCDDGERCEVRARSTLDLSELHALYGEEGLRALLAVALDEFDRQSLVFDAARARGQCMLAAEALHRLTGTAAFFVGDEQPLEPLTRAERALRLGDTSLAARTVPAARATLAALRAALVEEAAKLRKAR